MDLVWYASYGSNLNSGRFRRYLLGDDTHRGCRDPSPPRADRSHLLEATLFFADSSWRWEQGAVAYIDPGDSSDTPTMARLYLITWDQFSDVVAQENEGEAQEVSLARLVEEGHVMLSPGRYGRLAHLGWAQQCPIVSFTSPTTSSAAVFSKPSARYLQTIASGLVETFGLSLDQVVGYLASKGGVSGSYSAAALRGLLGD